MSKNDEKTNGNEQSVPKVIVERAVKTKGLADALIATVNDYTEKKGSLSIHELMDVFIKVMHTFNKQFVNREYKNMVENEKKKN